MFGSKFRTWMEAHIVRPRKKNQRQGGGKDCAAGGKPPIQAPPPTPRPNATNGCKHSCSSSSGGSASGGPGSSMEAMLGGNTVAGTNTRPGAPPSAGASLSSPESAYSTGYSTDGTSPGASFPPEYYINIRTGTHYFQQRPPQGQQPVPTPLPKAQPPKQVEFLLDTKSPALLKKDVPKRCFPPGHRRSESCDVVRPPPLPRAPPPIEEPTSLTPLQTLVLNASPSPRQRSRIRTNPWLGNGSASSGSSLGRKTGACEESGSTCSSGGNGGFRSGGSGSEGAIKRTPIVHTREPKKSTLGSCKESSPVTRSPVPTASWSPRRLAMTVSSSSSGSHRSSDDDLTLHEMMGKYDESYVYERETDILSDSDPTDCEDCGDTDVDTGQDGGDEQDPEDLDFIDKDSFQDLNLSDTERGPRRLGHSNYYHFPNELSRKLSRHRENVSRRAGSAPKRGGKARAPPRRRRPRDPTTASRSLGGTPVSLRRKPLDNIMEMRSHQSPVRMSVQRTLLIEDSQIESVKRRSNSVSYVSRSCEVRQSIPGGNYLANFDSEIALIEADKEADRKYKELILEAEHILVSMKAGTPIMGSPRRTLNNPPPNKRVELLRNAEMDLLPKVRTVESVPGSPKLCSPRFSPKKNHITNFIQMNSPELSRREANQNMSETNIFSSPKKLLVHSPPVPKPVFLKAPEPTRSIAKCPNSPRMARKNMSPASPMRKMGSSKPGSPMLQLNGRSVNSSSPICRPVTPQPISPILHIDDDSDESTEKEQSNSDFKKFDSAAYKTIPKALDFLDRTPPLKVDSQSGDSSSLVGGTSSSSDGDGDQVRMKAKEKRPPLLTFRSVDIGHRVPDSSYCPQSEPVKRKVYSCSATFDRLQKSLEPHHLIRQKSDGEGSTNDEQGSEECRAELREKVSRLRAERLEAERSRQQADLLQTQQNQQQGQFQRQLTLIRRQMLLQTIEGLKRSLEDQSASLKQTYHESDVKHKNIESF